MKANEGSPLFRVLTGLFRFVLLPSLVVLVLMGMRPLVWAAQDKARENLPEKKARTITVADRYIDRVVNGERISYLLGNVFIDRDSLTASSDTARYYRDREVYEFIGNVVLTRDGGVLTCRHAFYRRLEGASDAQAERPPVALPGLGRAGHGR